MGKKLYVGNLSYQVSSSDLEQLFGQRSLRGRPPVCDLDDVVPVRRLHEVADLPERQREGGLVELGDHLAAAELGVRRHRDVVEDLRADAIGGLNDALNRVRRQRARARDRLSVVRRLRGSGVQDVVVLDVVGAAPGEVGRAQQRVDRVAVGALDRVGQGEEAAVEQVRRVGDQQWSVDDARSLQFRPCERSRGWMS